MCEVVTRVNSHDRSYLLPLLAQYEPPRIQLIQKCFLPLIQHLKEQFPEQGSIYFTWEDDKDTEQLTFTTTDSITVSDVVKVYNSFMRLTPVLEPLETNT